jgi:hypothetical protein
MVEKEPYNEADTAQITSDLQVALGHLLTVGDHDVASLLSYGMLVSIAPPYRTNP